MGRTPLHDAAMYNQASCVALLLDSGADVNTGNEVSCCFLLLWSECSVLLCNVVALDNRLLYPTQGHNSVFIRAAASGSTECVELLLERGAKSDSRDHVSFFF